MNTSKILLAFAIASTQTLYGAENITNTTNSVQYFVAFKSNPPAYSRKIELAPHATIARPSTEWFIPLKPNNKGQYLLCPGCFKEAVQQQSPEFRGHLRITLGGILNMLTIDGMPVAKDGHMEVSNLLKKS